MAIEKLLTGSLRDQVRNLISTEDIVLEAIRDLVKDELKEHIKNRIDEDPDLKSELKEALNYYFTTQARTIYSEIKASRAAARLGMSLLPPELGEEVSEALVTLFEREIGNVLERAL